MFAQVISAIINHKHHHLYSPLPPQIQQELQTSLQKISEKIDITPYQTQIDALSKQLTEKQKECNKIEQVVQEKIADLRNEIDARMVLEDRIEVLEGKLKVAEENIGTIMTPMSPSTFVNVIFLVKC
jgi:DNA repair exonuclease SbcCD ATPase subunit